MPKPSILRVLKLKSYRMASNFLLKPPNSVAGMKILNKSLFEKDITVPCFILTTKPSAILPKLKPYLLKLENFKPVQSTKDEFCVYLNPELVKSSADVKLSEKLVFKTLKLGYENYSLEDIFRAVLPPNLEGVSSFTQIGHIVHVNLREHLWPYKDLIGEVLCDKVSKCRTVVNKVANIDNVYRNFCMEVLRGDDDFFVAVKENKCVFEFDFSKVYWNSRLCTEHERIVKKIDSGVVFDVFAGVGPFSLPLAKKKCKVYANDLNPESFKWLNHNAKKNKVDLTQFHTFNKDGKDFILNEIKTLLPDFVKEQVYILMNLPALAVNFLPHFVGLFGSKLPNFEKNPIVIFYCFAKGEDYENIARKQLFESLGFNIKDKIVEIFKVRTVSSLKEMMRITFKLDGEILGNQGKRKLENEEVSAKKCNYGEEIKITE